MDEAIDVFFDDAARGLVITFTTYSMRSDWWTSNVLFFEYGLNSIVQVTTLKSYPFKPNIYETT
jgi:hypothetical protein